MSKTIYVKNLPKNATAVDVRALFAAHGPVQSVKVVSSRQSGRPRVYGVVQMATPEAQAAAQSLNGKMYKGHRLKINQSGRPQGRRR